jgi:hypothetical protein
VLQYQGWQGAGMKWVRLNPDAAYVQAVMGGAAQAVDNDANIPVNYSNIVGMLEPEAVPDAITHAAAALELSDRVYTDNWQANLDGPLVQLGATAALELPHSVARLADGHTVIADGSSGPSEQGGPRGGRIIEVDEAGEVVWEYSTGLDFPHHAELDVDWERLLIADTGNDRVLELERAIGLATAQLEG